MKIIVNFQESLVSNILKVLEVLKVSKKRKRKGQEKKEKKEEQVGVNNREEPIQSEG